MASIILPEVHSSGLWTLKSPYQSLLLPSVYYTCIAVRKMEDFIVLGIDPFAAYYEPFNLEKSKYQEDLLAGHCIITVKTATNEVKSFPSSMLVSFPTGGGVLYQTLAIAIDLGSLPVDMDLTGLQNKLKDLVRDTVGVEGTPRLVNLSTKQLIDRESSKSIEAARSAKIRTSTTLTAENLALKAQVAELQAKLTDAENWILAHQ